MLAVTIKYLEVYLGNLNLPLGKSIILYKPLTQKGETNK